MSETSEVTDGTSGDGAPRPRAHRPWKDIILYGFARLMLFIVLTIVIQGAAYLIEAPLPLIMSSLLALIVALPLSMFVFRGLRIRVNEALADFNEDRRRHKAEMEEQLAGRM